MQRIFLGITSLLLVVAVGFFAPDNLRWMLSAAESVSDSLGDGLKGHIGLLWSMAGVETLLLLSVAVLLVGVLGNIALGIFDTKTVLLAGTLPLVAGAIKGILAVLNPIALLPIHSAAKTLMGQIPIEHRIRADLLGLEQVIQTGLIIAIVSLILTVAGLVWRGLYGIATTT